MPEISIIVPVYNVVNFLDRCVKSVLGQSFTDFELILVDDGSTDGSSDICDKYEKLDNRVVVIHKNNAGPGAARNTGIKRATGKYVSFIDSDDWYSSDAIEYLYKLMKKHNPSIVSASYILTSGEDRFNTKEFKERVLNRDEAIYEYMYIGMSRRIADFSPCAKLYKKEVFDRHRFPEGQFYEDGATILQMIMDCEYYVKSDKPIYFYYVRENSTVNSPFKYFHHSDLLLTGKQFVKLLKNENVRVRKLAEQKMQRTNFSSIMKIVYCGYDCSEENIEQKINEIYSEMRNYYWSLMCSPMPINRKIPLTILAINYRWPMKVLRWMQNK